MIGRASGLLALATVGVALTGCQTTQQKSAEIERQVREERQREAAEERQSTETRSRDPSPKSTEARSRTNRDRPTP